MPRIITACTQCSTEYLILHSKLDNGRGKFCSNDCKYQWKSKHVIHPNTRFALVKYRLEHNGGTNNQPHTEEAKIKIRKSNVGQVRTKETRDRQRQKKIEYYENHPEAVERFTKLRSTIKIPVKDTKPERMMHLALTLHGIEFEKHKPIKIEKSFHQVDIFIEPNICLEVDGNHWHANPDDGYVADDLIGEGKYAKDVWARDIKIIHELNLLGYNVIRIWESDILSDANSCAEKILSLIQSAIQRKVS